MLGSGAGLPAQLLGVVTGCRLSQTSVPVTTPSEKRTRKVQNLRASCFHPLKLISWMLWCWKSSHKRCHLPLGDENCLLVPFASCRISKKLEMVDLDSTPTHVVPHLENPHGCFSLELPGLGMEVMVVELLFGVGDMSFCCFLPPLAASPHPPACPLCPTSMVPISCLGTPGDFPAHVSLLVSWRSFSWVDVPQERGKMAVVPVGAELERHSRLGVAS